MGPKPKKGEKQGDYVSRAIAFFVGEGKPQEQASAIAYDMWRRRGKMKKSLEEFVKSIPMDMSINEIKEAIRTAANPLLPDPKKGYVEIVDIYLDGTCIISVSEDWNNYSYFQYDYSFNEKEEAVLSNPVEVERNWEEVDTQKATWSSAFMNDLPDSSFAYIEPGGKKDGEGKTEPRSLRHFPYKDASGKIDLPHLRNALARAPQSPFGPKAMPKLKRAARAAGVGDVKKSEPIFKVDSDKGLVYGVVLAPDLEDAQGDIVDAEEIEKAAHLFMESYRKQLSDMGDMHKKTTQDVIVVENYLAPVDFEINGGTVTKGSWVMVSKIKDAKMKEKVKKGEYTGYSIGGRGKRTPIVEEE